MKTSVWAVLLAALALSWGAYVVGKEVGKYESAMATKAIWERQSVCQSAPPPASSAARW